MGLLVSRGIPIPVYPARFALACDICMSNRTNYANASAILTDFVLECYQCLESKFDADGKAITADDAAIDFIAAWVCDPEAGSLPGLCRQYGLQWNVLAAWIRKDDKRNQRYKLAMADRGEMRRERLLDGWWETASLSVDKPAEHLDVHRARESLAKAEGMFKPEIGSGKGSITISFDEVDSRA